MSTLWLRLGAPWHPLRRAPRPRARHWRPWYLRGRFGTAKTERDATLATIDTVSRVYRIGHQISIRLRSTRGAATRDPSAQPRYHGISPRSLDLPVAWYPSAAAPQVEFCGDAELVVGWLKGTSKIADGEKSRVVQSVWNLLHTAYESELAQRRCTYPDWYRQMYRERNTRADELTNRATNTNRTQPFFLN